MDVGRKYRVLTRTGSVYDIEVDGDDEIVSLKPVEGGEEIKVRVKKIDEDKYIVYIGDEVIRVNISDETIYIDNEPMLLDKIIELLPVGGTVKLTEEKTPIARAGDIRAPLSGRIAEVKVKQGDLVKPGDIIALMVSMKMVIEVKSDVEGVVEEIHVKPGDVVKTGDLIMRVRVEKESDKRKVKEK